MYIIEVDSIVSGRDKQPYVRLLKDGQQIAQLSVAQSRAIAGDIVQAAARAEADAIIYAFFDKNDLPRDAAAALMLDFRLFRKALDTETLERRMTDPDTGKPV